MTKRLNSELSHIYNEDKKMKYSKTITLETVDGYHLIKFAVVECESMKAVDNELRTWLRDYPELVKNENNKKILKMVLNDK